MIYLSTCVRNFLIGFYCLAVIFPCMANFFGSVACGQGFFIHRDLETGIYSDVQRFISYRYMRHIWTTSDSVMATIVQNGGYDGRGLALYKSLDGGLNWTFEMEISNDNGIVSDGTIDSNNNILLVTSFMSDKQTIDVDYIRLAYDSFSQSWSIDPLTPTTVFASGRRYKASRATVAVDSNSIVWCAFRLEDANTGIFMIMVYYSVDGGSTWENSGNKFGTMNRLDEKSAKVIAVNSRIAVIYQDVKGGISQLDRFKKWAYREDSQNLQDYWTDESIAKMEADSGDPLGSHWSVAADDFGNIHLSYEDNGIKYLKYNAVSDYWEAPWLAVLDGNYSNISVSANNDLYLFARNLTGKKIIARGYSSTRKKWSKWISISSQNYDGMLRMSSPERFNNHLPLLYQVGGSKPFQLIYNLLDLP